MKASEATLKKALHLWESPITGNAVVILRQDESSGPGPEDIRVIVADLDMGEPFCFQLDELTVMLRATQEDDYSYSWCADNDPEIVNHVAENQPSNWD